MNYHRSLKLMSHGCILFLSRTEPGPLSVRAIGPLPIYPTRQSAPVQSYNST